MAHVLNLHSELDISKSQDLQNSLPKGYTSVVVPPPTPPVNLNREKSTLQIKKTAIYSGVKKLVLNIKLWFHANSLPPPLSLVDFFLVKKKGGGGGGGDLERHFDIQPISAKKGGGELARHRYFFVKMVSSTGIFTNQAKFDFRTKNLLG